MTSCEHDLYQALPLSVASNFTGKKILYLGNYKNRKRKHALRKVIFTEESHI